MKTRHLIALLQKDYVTIQVVFPPTPGKPVSNKPYTYKAKGEIKIDDYVIVDSPYSGIVACKVVGVDPSPRIDPDAEFTYKWIIQKVDRTEYDQRLAAEQAFLDTMQEVERLKQKKALLADLEAYTQDCPEAQPLLTAAISRLQEA